VRSLSLILPMQQMITMTTMILKKRRRKVETLKLTYSSLRLFKKRKPVAPTRK